MAVIDGERRVVSVLMADVAGSTAIGERLGPERSKFLFDEVMRLMTAEIERYDGTVAQLLGDGLLAMFGAPIAHEDDSERAVRAGLAIQRALAEYAEGVAEAYGVELRARIAVNTGPVVVTPGAGDDSRRYNALGDTVNVTARLQALADEAAVTLGPQTAAQVRGCFELEQLGETTLRGREAPIDRFRVIGELEHARRRPAEPLVGRDRELADVSDGLERLAQGIGMIVTVTGEPGIGKSRLVADAIEPLRDRLTVLEGRALSYTESFPYWPVRELLRDWLGAGATAAEARVRLDLKTALHGVFGDDPEPYPFLAALAGLPPDPETNQVLREFSREAMHRRSMEVMAELLCRLSRDRPLLVVLEDLHWADEPTLDLIDSLLELTESEPFGMVLLYLTDREAGSWRVGERARQRFPHRYREVELRPLSDSAGNELLDDLAGAPVSDNVSALLTQRAGGNPLFLSEALRDLIERGALQRSDNGWWADDADPLEVPVLVQGVLQARLDRLDPPAREVVAVAAVAGRRFGTPLLEQLVDPGTLPAALSQLQRMELIVEEQRRPFPSYRFRHGLVQEAAYATITDARRKVLHGQVGLALERLIDDEGGPSPRLLAHLARHFREADDAARAATYLIRAGDEARALYADQEAIHHYREARRFLQQLGDDRRSRETLFKIALVHHLAFDYPAAEDAYDEAFACKVEPIVQVEATERLVTATKRPTELAPGLDYVAESYMITEHVFSGLLQVDADLNVMPALADNFRVSADGLSYLFQIRGSARWSDGVPVTAHDFVQTWNRTRELDTVTAFLLEDVEHAEALDDHTLELRLREPRNYFLYVLAACPSYPWPAHLVAERGDDWHREEPLVSNGPYVVETCDDEQLVLRANPQFDGPRGNIDHVCMQFKPTAVRGTAALWEDEELDVLSNVEHLLTGAHTLAEVSPALGTSMVGFRPEGAFADIRVRQALTAPLVKLMENLEDAGMMVRPARGGGLLPPAMPGHLHNVQAPVDMERAAELLAESGYPGGDGLPAVRLAAIHPMEPMLAGLEELMGRLGVTVELELLDQGSMVSTVDADSWISGWVADYPDPHGFFRGLLSKRHLGVLNDPTLTQLLADASASRDRDARLALFAEVDRRLVSEALMVPLSYARSVLLKRPWVHGIWSNALTSLRFDQATVDR